jgi:glycine hydroxymethyltransferase
VTANGRVTTLVSIHGSFVCGHGNRRRRTARSTVPTTRRCVLRADDRAWLPPHAAARERAVLAAVGEPDAAGMRRWLADRLEESRRLHERECWNLNPAANVMDPRAEALLAAGAGTRPSLGHPGAKYETGLEALEQIEVVAAALAREVFGARHAEVRLPSGATANLTAFLAAGSAGDVLVAPPPSIGGHVTHHADGAAGLAGFVTLAAPVDPAGHTIDVDRLAAQVREHRPAVVTVGTSCNLLPHPVSAIREVADTVGATVVFDAAHVAGLIAGGAWPNPLREGAHVVSMSTYKSLAGPAGGLLLTDDDALAQRVDAIAFPGLTANFDVGRVAALAATLAGWREDGAAYATAMLETGATFGQALLRAGAPVHVTAGGPTASHVVALDVRSQGGGDVAAARLRDANLLASAIGLPVPQGDGPAPGLRLGVNELVRFGVEGDAAVVVAELVAEALAGDPTAVAPTVTAHRRAHTRLHHLAAD